MLKLMETLFFKLLCMTPVLRHAPWHLCRETPLVLSTEASAVPLAWEQQLGSRHCAPWLEVVHGSGQAGDSAREASGWATGQHPIVLQVCFIENAKYMPNRFKLPCVKGCALARPLALPTAPLGGRGKGG